MQFWSEKSEIGKSRQHVIPARSSYKDIRRALPPNPFHALTSNSVAVASTCGSRSTTQVPPCDAHADVSLHLSTIRPFECFRPLVQAFLKVYPCKTREVQALGRSTWNSKVSLSNLWHRAYIGPRGGTCQINSLKRKTLKNLKTFSEFGEFTWHPNDCPELFWTEPTNQCPKIIVVTLLLRPLFHVGL